MSTRIQAQAPAMHKEQAMRSLIRRIAQQLVEEAKREAASQTSQASIEMKAQVQQA